MRRSLTVALLTILAVPAFAQPAISRLDAFFPSTTSPGGAAITAGTALPNGFTLQITGSGFTSPFVVNWIDNNNAANNTSFSSNAESAFLVDSTTIQVPSIPPALVATATSITVQVVIGSSPAASAPFTVNAALPATIPVTGSPVVLPAGVVGGNYAQPLFPTGDGTAPFTISLQSGTLPPGLPVFSPQGTVSPYDNFYVGSPTAAGTYTFRLGIADAWGNSTALPYSLAITPPPVISSLNPPIIPAGSLGFTLTVNGANFVPGSIVSWRSTLTGNTNLATTYVSATQLTALVPANLIQLHDLPVIRVTVPGGGFVEADYIVQYPIISGVTPPYVTAGHPAFTLTVTGQYFLTVPSVTQIFLGGVGLPTISPSPGVLQATVPASLVATAGTPTFWVQNPGGQISFAFGDYIVFPPDVVTSLSPTNRTAGTGAFSLTINGTNLVNVACVLWDQSAITTFSSSGSTQITVTIPAAFLTSGIHNVGILTTDGAPSNKLPFTVNPPLTITSPPPPSGTAQTNYSFTLAAAGGSPPYHWSATGLPAGLSLNQATGAISGTPSAAGSSTVSVTVTDSGQLSASSQYTLTINPYIPPLQIITTSPLPDGVSGATYGAQFAATGGVPGYSFAATAGSLPAGLSLSSNGILSGTPAKTGDYRFTVQVTDSTGATASAGFLLTIKAPPLTITTSAFADAPLGTAFNTQFTATGGVPPYVWGASGSIPSGTTFNGSGVLSGTANSIGAFQFTIQATDSVGTVATKAYSINITKQSLTIGGSAGNGQVGVPYSATFTASGGKAPYSFSASGLPAGLTFSGTSIGGTPAPGSQGTYTVTVTVTDAAGATASATSSVTITAAALQITTDSLPNGTIGSPYSASVSASGGAPPYTFSAGGLPDGVEHVGRRGDQRDHPGHRGSRQFHRDRHRDRFQGSYRQPVVHLDGGAALARHHRDLEEHRDRGRTVLRDGFGHRRQAALHVVWIRAGRQRFGGRRNHRDVHDAGIGGRERQRERQRRRHRQPDVPDQRSVACVAALHSRRSSGHRQPRQSKHGAGDPGVAVSRGRHRHTDHDLRAGFRPGRSRGPILHRRAYRADDRAGGRNRGDPGCRRADRDGCGYRHHHDAPAGLGTGHHAHPGAPADVADQCRRAVIRSVTATRSGSTFTVTVVGFATDRD